MSWFSTITAGDALNAIITVGIGIIGFVIQHKIQDNTLGLFLQWLAKAYDDLSYASSIVMYNGYSDRQITADETERSNRAKDILNQAKFYGLEKEFEPLVGRITKAWAIYHTNKMMNQNEEQLKYPDGQSVFHILYDVNSSLPEFFHNLKIKYKIPTPKYSNATTEKRK